MLLVLWLLLICTIVDTTRVSTTTASGAQALTTPTRLVSTTRHRRRPRSGVILPSRRRRRCWLQFDWIQWQHAALFFQLRLDALQRVEDEHRATQARLDLLLRPGAQLEHADVQYRLTLRR